jgi:hypothetical protein
MWQLTIEVGCLARTEWFGGLSHAYFLPNDGIKVFGITVLLYSEILPKTTIL